MNIQGDVVTIHSLLNDPKPDGIAVQAAGGGVIKAFNLNVNFPQVCDDFHIFSAATHACCRGMARFRI